MIHDHPFGAMQAQLSTCQSSEAGARQADRADCEIDAGLRQRGASGITVQVLDLSTHGFRASTHLELPTGTDVLLKLTGLEPLHSRVTWMNGCLVGCEFVRPLHPAVMQMVVRR